MNPIINAKDRSLDVQASGLPDVSAAVQYFLQPMIFFQVTKQNVDGFVQEVENKICAQAVRTPMKAQEVALKPEGQRTWKWENLITTSDIILYPDDIVKFDSDVFRVMGKNDWKEYGYIQYSLGQDTTSC